MVILGQSKMIPMVSIRCHMKMGEFVSPKRGARQFINPAEPRFRFYAHLEHSCSSFCDQFPRTILTNVSLRFNRAALHVRMGQAATITLCFRLLAFSNCTCFSDNTNSRIIQHGEIVNLLIICTSLKDTVTSVKMNSLANAAL